jgi:hypothetical protein
VGDDPLNGTWYSGAGSRLELRVEESGLRGTFYRAEDGSARPLVGSVDPDASQPHRALGFSICWIADDESSPYRSVTSYTGQFHADRNEIATIFLLVDETSSQKQYASTFVGYDNFTRERTA